MQTVLTATPIRNGLFSNEFNFGGGFAIRQIGPILWDLSTAKGFMSDDERSKLSNTRYWLCSTKDYDSWLLANSDPDTFETTRLAMSALQIICPRGGPNVYMK